MTFLKSLVELDAVKDSGKNTEKHWMRERMAAAGIFNWEVLFAIQLNSLHFLIENCLGSPRCNLLGDWKLSNWFWWMLFRSTWNNSNRITCDDLYSIFITQNGCSVICM